MVGCGVDGLEHITVQQIRAKKARAEKITMLTAYSYPVAALLDKAGVDIILVGDSLANVALGLKSTKEVGMQEMIHHASAVGRAVKNALLVGDMPFDAYQNTDKSTALINAKRFIEEAGCDAVKVEWFDNCLDIIGNFIENGIEVMGHIGLTPQTAERLGGFKVQGKDAVSATRLIKSAKALQDVGCFCIVLECIPFQLAELITKAVSIPTIGIGAGAYCDGQVLVTDDMLGLYCGRLPRFVKRYACLERVILDAVSKFQQEVKDGHFPDEDHSYSMAEEEIDKIKKEMI